MTTHRKAENVESEAISLAQASLYEGLDFDTVVKVLRAHWVAELRETADRLEKVASG